MKKLAGCTLNNILHFQKKLVTEQYPWGTLAFRCKFTEQTQAIYVQHRFSHYHSRGGSCKYESNLCKSCSLHCLSLSNPLKPPPPIIQITFPNIQPYYTTEVLKSNMKIIPWSPMLNDVIVEEPNT